MKGLFIKDLYMMKHYCKSYLLITAVFLIVSISDTGNSFFAFYPCLLCGMIPVNLLGYDERSRFIEYSATLPYTKTQIVSSKYILGLFVQIAVLLVIGAVQGIKMAITGNFFLGDFAVMMLSALIVSTFASSIPLPFVFKYGVEKGRIAYYVMIGFVCAAGVLFSKIIKENVVSNIKSTAIFTVLSVLGICVYILSWYLSVVFYKKREF